MFFGERHHFDPIYDFVDGHPVHRGKYGQPSMGYARVDMETGRECGHVHTVFERAKECEEVEGGVVFEVQFHRFANAINYTPP